MIIGLLKEIKESENRVALTPSGAEILKDHGHTVLVEKGAGLGSNFPDDAYAAAGATIHSTKEIFSQSELILKVKEPLEQEYAQMKPNQFVFTFFHFASSQELTHCAIASKCIAIAYETIEKANGSLPILAPMSEIAGKLSAQIGATYLQKNHSGRGLLLGGVPGVEPAIVVVLGGGAVGINAAKVAAGMGAQVFILDVNIERLKYLSDVLPANVTTLVSNSANIKNLLPKADLVVSGALIPGAKAPKLITREMVKTMKPGSVIVDPSIDQGGSTETSRPTTHNNPVYIEEGVIHYCVTNMPGAVPMTATIALTNASLPYVLKIANGGKQTLLNDPELSKGVNMVHGKITYKAIADAFNLPYTLLQEAL